MRLPACLAVVVLATLTACSTGPSKGDVEKAMARFVHDELSETAQVKDVKVGECKEASGTPGYNCAVEMGITMRNHNESMAGVFTLSKADGNWRVIAVVNRTW